MISVVGMAAAASHFAEGSIKTKATCDSRMIPMPNITRSSRGAMIEFMGKSSRTRGFERSANRPPLSTPNRQTSGLIRLPEVPEPKAPGECLPVHPGAEARGETQAGFAAGQQRHGVVAEIARGVGRGRDEQRGAVGGQGEHGGPVVARPGGFHLGVRQLVILVGDGEEVVLTQQPAVLAGPREEQELARRELAGRN